MKDYDAGSQEVHEALTEALYSNSALDEACHHAAVDRTFKEDTHQEYVAFVLSEEWTDDEYMGFRVRENMGAKSVREDCNELLTTYWNNRALWWYEAIGAMDLRNRVEVNRIAVLWKKG